MDAAAEIGTNPVSKHRIQTECCGEWASWRGTRRPNPSREAKLSCADEDREVFIFPVQLTTSRIGNLTRLIHTLLSYVMTIHTYTYIVIHSTCNSSIYLTPVAFTYITCNCIIDATSTLRLLPSIKYVYQFLWPVVRSRPPISMNCNVVWIWLYHARLLGR